MKKTLTALLALLTVLVVGCAALDDALLTRTTNAPPQTIVTPDGSTVEVPAVVSYDVNPGVQTAIDIGGSLPLPWAGVAAIALGWGAQLYRNVRNKRALVSVVQGVDAFRRTLETTPEGKQLDERLKSVLAKRQYEMGVFRDIVKILDRYTASARTG